ncbi:MAG: hypothetical protein EBV86_02580 [Marivivens sp.]|nr:hypothetical protein [Marivivens sp.]
MASVAEPYGALPVGSLSASGSFTGKTRLIPIQSGYATGIFSGDFVDLDTNGYVVNSYTDEVAQTELACIGVFMGCRYTDPVTNTRLYSTQWPAAKVASDAEAYVLDDPNILLKMQADGSMDVTTRGLNVGIKPTFGSTEFGASRNAIDQSSAATTATLPLRVVTFCEGVNSTVGDAYTDLIVKFNAPSSSSASPHRYFSATGSGGGTSGPLPLQTTLLALFAATDTGEGYIFNFDEGAGASVMDDTHSDTTTYNGWFSGEGVSYDGASNFARVGFTDNYDYSIDVNGQLSGASNSTKAQITAYPYTSSPNPGGGEGIFNTIKGGGPGTFVLYFQNPGEGTGTLLEHYDAGSRVFYGTNFKGRYFSYSDGRGKSITNAESRQTFNKWGLPQCAVWTLSDTGTWSFYMNGELVRSDSGFSTTTSSNDFQGAYISSLGGGDKMGSYQTAAWITDLVADADTVASIWQSCLSPGFDGASSYFGPTKQALLPSAMDYAAQVEAFHGFEGTTDSIQDKAVDFTSAGVGAATFDTLQITQVGSPQAGYIAEDGSCVSAVTSSNIEFAAIFDAGSKNFGVDLLMNTNGTPGSEGAGGLIFRYVDNQNYYRARILSNNLTLYKVTGGVETSIFGAGMTGGTAIRRCRIVLLDQHLYIGSWDYNYEIDNGGDINSQFQDGSYTLTDHLTATKFGWAAEYGGGVWPTCLSIALFRSIGTSA